MKMHEIEMGEVLGRTVVSSFVDCTERWSKVKPQSVGAIVVLIANAFGVTAFWERSPTNRHRVTYWGTKGPVTVAVHAHKVVTRAVLQEWEDYKTRVRYQGGVLPRNAKQSFLRGWCFRVVSKLEALVPKTEELERIKKAAAAKAGVKEIPTAESRDDDLLEDAVIAGLRAGEKFSIYQPLEKKDE
jgi:hypothetical protein